MLKFTYLNSKKKQEKALTQRLKRLGDELDEIADCISDAEASFNEVDDPALTEALIYDRAALEARRSYLLRELKELTG